jgi:hypothetical protein
MGHENGTASTGGVGLADVQRSAATGSGPQRLIMVVQQFSRSLMAGRRAPVDVLRGLPRVRPGRTSAEVTAFADGYETVSGYRVGVDYLSQGRVFVAVRADRVVGGFVVNVDPPFRTVQRLPDPLRERVMADCSSVGTVELACVWLAPQARGNVASMMVWGHLLWAASRAGRAQVLFGTEVDSLRRLYERFQPRLVYGGLVRVDGQEREGWVYTIPVGRWRVALLRTAAWRWTR